MVRLAYLLLWVFIFSVPWEGVIRVGGVSVVSRLTGVIALAITLLAVLLTGRLRRFHALHFAAMAFVLITGVELFLLGGNNKLPSKYLTFVQLFAMMWMMWQLAPSRRALYGLMLAYIVGSYAASIGTLLMFRSEAEVLRRFAVGGVDRNDLAMTLALAVPMAWYLASVYQRPLLRLFCRAYLPVGLLALGLTGSRGGMIVAFVALTIVPLSMTKLTPARVAAAMATLVLTGVLAAVYVPEKVVQRLATTQSDVESLSFGGRFRLWVAGLQAFVHKPLMGYGTGGYIHAIYPMLGDQSLVAHNSYLSVLVEEGIIGFLCYSAMLLTAAVAVMKLPRPERRFAQVQLASLYLAMAPLTWEDRKSVWIILGVLVGLSQAAVSLRRPSAQAASAPLEPVPRPPRRGVLPGTRASSGAQR